MTKPRPPLLSTCLARAALRGDRGEVLRAGLAEEFERRAVATDGATSRAWYRRQVRAAVLDWWQPDNVRTRRLLVRRERGDRFRLPRQLPHTSPPRTRLVETLIQDLRFGLRALRAQPTFALVTIGALALGSGGATAIFSVVDAVVLRPLPFAEPDRIMTVWETSGDWLHNPAAPANFIDWRSQAASFSSMAALTGSTHNLVGQDEPRRLSGYRVTASLHDVLGVMPAMGRRITDEDDRYGAPRAALLSHALWSTAFGADPDLVGDTIALDGEPTTVLGIMPREFSYPAAGIDIWVPMQFSPEEEARRGFRSFQVLGRLADGVTPEAAHDEMVRIAAGLSQQYPDANEHVSANVIPLRREWVGHVQPTLIALVGAVGLLLLVACINVANLLLARGAGRQEEIAIRAAIGASPGRVARQTFTESVQLAVLGAAGGMALAIPGAQFLRTLVPAYVPLAARVGVDLRAVAFSLAVALATSVLFGAGPALRASRLDLSLTARGRRSTRSGNTTRRALIVAQVALAIVLLIGAGLLVRSFAAVANQELGFDAAGVLRASVDLTGARYDDDDARRRFYARLLDETAAIPGVESAAMVTRAPLGMSGGALIYTPFEQATAPQDATYRLVTPEYFRTLAIELRGRDFNLDDRTGSEPVAIVGAELARRHWPNADALGQRLKIGDDDSASPWLRVVGVADDVRQWDIELAARPAIYVPVAQTRMGFFAPRDLVVRTAGDPLSLAPGVRAAVRAIDPDLPIAGLMPLRDLVARATGSRRFQMNLLAAFAAIAAGIAMIGLYGIIAYMVQTRTHELGIRLALGAARRRVLLLVLGQGGALVGAGVAIGVVSATFAVRAVQGLLYEIEPLDPVTFALVPAALTVVALLALLVPARRASAIDPASALRRD